MDDAEALLKRIAERRGDHSVVANDWRNLAIVMVRLGEFARARKAIEQTEIASRFELIEALRSQIESRASEAIEQLRAYLYLCLSLLMSERVEHEESIRLAYEMHSLLEGAETTVLRLRSRRFSGGDPTEVQDRMRRLRSKITRLRLSLDGSDDRVRLESQIRHYQNELEETELNWSAVTNVDRLDQEFLAERSKAVQVSIPEDTALVEFTTYSRLVPGAVDPLAGEASYAAFVVRREEVPIRLVDLGPGQPIDELVEQFRSTVKDYHSDDWYTSPVSRFRSDCSNPCGPSLLESGGS